MNNLHHLYQNIVINWVIDHFDNKYMYEDYVIIPRDIENASDYWLKQKDFMKGNLMDLEDAQNMQTDEQFYQFLVDKCHIKWPHYFFEKLYDYDSDNDI